MTILAFMKKATPYVVAVLLPCMLGSCANPALASAQRGALGAIANRGDGTTQQSKFQADQNRVRNESTAVGAVVGVVAFRVAAVAAARRFGPVGALAVILGGALFGAALGDKAGQHVAMKKALAQTTEANLDACIQESIKENRRAQGEIQNLRQKLANIKKGISNARAKNDTRALAGYKKDLQSLHGSYAGPIKNLDTGILEQSKVIAKAGSGNSRYAGLNNSLTELKQSRSQLESDCREVASLFISL